MIKKMQVKSTWNELDEEMVCARNNITLRPTWIKVYMETEKYELDSNPIKYT